MHRTFQKYRYFFIELIICIILAILLVVFSLFRLSTPISEWWSRNAISLYQKVFAPFIRLIPFSLIELFFIILVVLLVVLLVTAIVLFVRNPKKKKGLNVIMWIPMLSLLFVTVYQGTAGIAYSREDLPLVLYEDEIENETYLEIAEYFIDDLNECASHLDFDEKGDAICPYSFDELNDILIEEYHKYDYCEYLSEGIYKTKKMLIPWVFSQSHITGMFFSVTTESIINTDMPVASWGNTMLHELSHSRGVMREYDAQTMALFVGIQSDDYYVRYSTYFETIYCIQNLVRAVDSTAWNPLYNKIDIRVRNNWSYESEYWSEYHLFSDIGNWFNNLYLRLITNGNDTTEAYTDPGATITPSESEEEPPIISLSLYQQMYVSVYYDVLALHN
ncbi:MAG: DUF3810 domain-containing protein [Coprobacillus sp.]|nr:DUF3810 domain-containing protein [Coprobacillus sp.]